MLNYHKIQDIFERFLNIVLDLSPPEILVSVFLSSELLPQLTDSRVSSDKQLKKLTFKFMIDEFHIMKYLI